MTSPSPTLFAGCSPEIAADGDGRILAVGQGARQAAGPSAHIVELHGRCLPGLADSHIHLGWTARQRLSLDLTGARDAWEAANRVREHARSLAADAWVTAHHLDDSAWKPSALIDRHVLDAAADGRPVFIHRRDTHLAVVSSEALRRADISITTGDPLGGVIDRDENGEPTGVLRENAAELVRRIVPEPSRADLRTALRAVCDHLATVGVTSVHAIEPTEDLELLRSLSTAGELPQRVSLLLPMASLDDLIAHGVRSGDGDERMRTWGVKLFLDGSLGSDTAEMLDGRGVAVLPQPELVEIVARARHAGINLAIHAIGDAAVRRGLDALADAGRSPGWRPRIEHAQCVHPEDVPRFADIGVIASMQPVHAISDRGVADERWPGLTQHAYAWRPLLDAGAILAFGSDAPVDDPAPLSGIRAATTWRSRVAWHPELAIDEDSALRAYTTSAAYAVGMEDRVGALRPGQWCDLTVVDGDHVTATVVGGAVTWQG